MTSHAPRRPWPLPRDGTLLESWRAGSNIGRMGGGQSAVIRPSGPPLLPGRKCCGVRIRSFGEVRESREWFVFGQEDVLRSLWLDAGLEEGDSCLQLRGTGSRGRQRRNKHGAAIAAARNSGGLEPRGPGELQGPGHSGLGAKPPPHSKASKCWRRGHPVPGLDVFATPSEASGWCVPNGTRLPGNSRSDGGKEPDLKREVASKYPNFARLGSPTFTAHTSPFVAVCLSSRVRNKRDCMRRTRSCWERPPYFLGKEKANAPSVLPIVCAVLPVQRRLLPLLGFHGKTGSM